MEKNMWKVIHTWVSIDFIEENLKNIKDFFEEVTEDDLRDLYCYRIFGTDYETTKFNLEVLRAEWRVCIPNSDCDNINSDWTCWCS